MAEFKKVEEAETTSKRYACTIPAYSYDELQALAHDTPENFLKDVLEVTGGNLESAADLLVKSYNSEARKAASGIDEVFKIAVQYIAAMPKLKGANPFKVAAKMRAGEFGNLS